MVGYGVENWALKDVTVTTPIAGVQVLHYPTRGIRQRFRGIHVTFTTDATVATRKIWLVALGQTWAMPVRVSPYTQAASLSFEYVFVADGEDSDAAYDAATRTVRVGHELWMDYMHGLSVFAVNIAATDAFTVCKLRVLEAIMPAEM